jgi:excisionase family DNA binding protein
LLPDFLGLPLPATFSAVAQGGGQLLDILEISIPLRVSIGEAAQATGLSQWSIKQLLRQGKLRAKKHGRRTLIDYVSLKSYVDNLPDARFARPRMRTKANVETEAA